MSRFSTRFAKIGAVVISVGVVFYAGFLLGTRNIKDESVVQNLSHIRNLDSDGTAIAFDSNPVEDFSEVDFANFWKVWRILDQNFVPVSTSSKDRISEQARVNGAIAGLANSYSDQFTVFMPPAETKQFKEQTDGSFEGIGAALANIDERLIITAIVKGAPAEKSGLLPGDYISAIDGRKTDGQKVDDTVKLIRGPKGSVVELMVLRGTESNPKPFKITRDTIATVSTVQAVEDKVEQVVRKISKQIEIITTPIKSIVGAKSEKAEKKLSRDFYVFGLLNFSRSSGAAFADEIKKLNQSGSRKMILDLRNNPGGYIDLAVEAASYFLPEGSIVVSERTMTEEHIERSKGYKLLANPDELKIVILVNENTASAAEILAGALEEHGRATIVGTRTYGKGSVQRVIDLAGGASLKVTIARWFLPSGKTISNVGITPDVVVTPTPENTKDGTDPVFEKAVELLLTASSTASH